MDINAITTEMIQGYIKDNAKCLAATSIRKHLELLRQILDSAVEDELLPKNPAKSKRLRIFGKPSKKVLAYTDEEFLAMEELLQYLHSSDRLYVALSIYAGIRKGEICALTWDDIDFKHGIITVNKVVEWPSSNQGDLKATTKTLNGVRTVHMLPRLRIILEKEQKSGIYLIHGPRSCADSVPSHEVMHRMDDRINRIAQKYGNETHFGNRVGRHTMATFMGNAHIDDISITGTLGHYDIHFTQKHYMNPQSHQMDESMKILDQYLDSFKMSEEEWNIS